VGRQCAGLVAAGHRVVRYDYRGFGRSTTEEVEFSSRADLLAVLDTFGIRRAALVGNSRGGQIAFDTAIEFPERVVAVVGVGAGLGGFEGKLTAEEQALFDEGERLEAAGQSDAETMVDLEVRVWVDGPGQPADRVDGSIRESVRAMDSAALPAGPRHGPVDRAETRRQTIGSAICVAPFWRSPAPSTSPTSSRPRTASSRPRRMPGPSSGRTSPT